jgi:hypothetical protein
MKDDLMQRDRYDNDLSTSSALARDHYIVGVDRILSGAADMVQPFEAAVEADAGFALGYAGLARALVLSNDMRGAKAALANAVGVAGGITAREASHLNVMQLQFGGKAAEALVAMKAHLFDHPRDVMIAGLGIGVFGMIGFSGHAGREAENYALSASLLPHYGDDWWMLGQHAFSACEVGQLETADKLIERSLTLKSDNSHGAHVRSHVYYEAGKLDDGIAYLEDWLPSYDRCAMMHGHLSWHVALWALEQGDTDKMWAWVDADVKPDASQGLPINIITDTASILHRAELAGQFVPAERWKHVSDYAAKVFPKTGQSFVDMHAALAHAMAGRSDLLKMYMSEAKGFAADVVQDCAGAFDAIARQAWGEATTFLSSALVDDARLGGSRAQRDLLEFSLMNVLLRQGKSEEAERIIGLRRPLQAHGAH